MRTAQRLNRLVGIARQQGITIRYEYLEGKRGGVCWFGNRYWLFIDIALPVSEQVDQVEQALSEFIGDSKETRQTWSQAA